MITPCLAICKFDRHGICIGCKRTREQVENWKFYTDEERFRLMKEFGYANKRMGREERLRRYDRG